MQSNNLRSIAYLTVNGADPVDEIEAASAAGLDAVGLRVSSPAGLQLAHAVLGQPNRIRDIRAALDRTGVRVLDTELVTMTAGTRVADVLPVLEISAELGATFLQATSEDPDWSRALNTFGEICDQANRFGLKIAFEFMQWRAVKSIEDVTRFLTGAGQPNAGIVLDMLHLSRSGGSPQAVAKVPPKFLFYVQLCDATSELPATDQELIAEARGGRLYPGEGTLWLDQVFDVLPDDIGISIEVPPGPAIGNSTHERTQSAARALDRWLAQYRARSGS